MKISVRARFIFLSAAAIWLGAGGPRAAQASNAVVNGSFEANPFAFSGTLSLGCGNTLSGWKTQCSADTIYPWGLSYPNAYNAGPTPYGHQWIILGDFGMGGSAIWQTVSGFTPGRTYTLSFALASEEGGGGSQVLVSFPSGSSSGGKVFTAPPIGANHWDKWGSFSISFVATSTDVTIRFDGLPNSVALDPGLDNVQINAQSGITLSRLSLTAVQAVGTPSGGTFAYNTTPVLGSRFATISFAAGVSATTNPNITKLTAPSGTGAPTPGGLETVKAQYTVNGATVTDTLQVSTFGMSCYMIALESDYGTPPDSCASTRLYGQTISGSVTNPNGLPGTYCASFIANVKLQGSAQLNSGQDIQYNVGTQKIVKVSAIKGSDGTPVVAGRTVARDYAIIPAKGVLVDVDQVGTGLLANDSGGAIKGYRLDLFNGAGKAACAGYPNPVKVGACETAQPNCPGTGLK
jgi:3D (Asp-Asp-Asp) domain-containing protein